MAQEIKNILTGSRALRRLLTDAENNTLKQAYIFEGIKGIGKYTAAQLFAYAVHCTGKPKPCFKCGHCKKHMAGTHSDFFVIEGESTIKVEDIRALTDELYIKPALSDKKIFVIRNADNMNQNAQNALLKSFEEPPLYAVIILLSENTDNLLPTIRSRGVKILFEPFTESSVKDYIKNVYPQKADEAAFIAKYSGGVIGKAIDICEDTEFFSKREAMFNACAKLTDGRLSIIELSDVFEIKSRKSNAENSRLYFELFLSFMRDAAALKTKTDILNEDKRFLLEQFASKTTLSAILSVISRSAQISSQLNSSMKYELWIVNLLINCWEDIHGKGNRS